jgi:choline-sulfatase
MTRLAAGVAQTLAWVLAVAATSAASPAGATAGDRAGRPASVLLITIDTLRVDRLSGYGYHLPTTPAIDRMIADGARFDQARTVEPLTGPAVASMLTSLYPHEHGATRNGLPVHAGLPSLAKELGALGYETAAFVANWTLSDRLSGLGDHFQRYEEVMTKRRWLGLIGAEATVKEVNQAALAWLEQRGQIGRPYFLWLHYSEPHAPYLFQSSVAERLGYNRRSRWTPGERYDTEVAFVDDHVGEILTAVVKRARLPDDLLVVLLSDHGEALGEHGYWGHGALLHEPGLRIPWVVYWPGRVSRQEIAEPASILDLAPTIMGLLGHPVAAGYRGVDWSAVLTGTGTGDPGRTLWFQTHKGRVIGNPDPVSARLGGLTGLGMLRDGRKELVQIERRDRTLFDLVRDPGEHLDISGAGDRPSPELQAWIDHVKEALANPDQPPPIELSAEDIRKLRALGYLGN